MHRSLTFGENSIIWRQWWKFLSTWETKMKCLQSCHNWLGKVINTYILRLHLPGALTHTLSHALIHPHVRAHPLWYKHTHTRTHTHFPAPSASLRKAWNRSKSTFTIFQEDGNCIFNDIFFGRLSERRFNETFGDFKRFFFKKCQRHLDCKCTDVFADHTSARRRHEYVDR